MEENQEVKSIGRNLVSKYVDNKIKIRKHREKYNWYHLLSEF